ncbi:hypothetical protein AVEN_67912-1 [Araneus ventricosus]|uniref:Uncharacterized protein n=1 Tax=Araneus ventricosus TaxID=182803 RepID=A0A4Y2QMI6_ARAVE|nr:hypothetical protein AVEN_239435-1 [Araneus ventricosus]GBN64531.1 hypothetical protein AVEN_67912-1 [Araneus ventricosus]
MSLQCLFLLYNEYPIRHFHPNEASFITVEDLNPSASSDSDTNFPASDFSNLATSPFDFAKLAARSREHSDEIRGKRRKTRQIFRRKSRRKPKPQRTEVNQYPGLTVLK